MLKINNGKNYNLEERTKKFSKSIIDLCKLIEPTSVIKPLINQLIRSSTSIGANYFEANGAASKKDFKNKIFICKKESKETMYWLEMLAHADKVNIKNYRVLWKEAQELTLIFSTIAKNTN